MARTSANERIAQGQKMVEEWTAAGFGSAKSCLFVGDMVTRMQSGKGMSPKQRTWFDSVVSQPTPVVQNSEMVGRLREAAKVEGLQTSEAQALQDFASRLARGYALTEKQVAFMNVLLGRAEKVEAEGPWVPTAEEKESIMLGLSLTKKYSSHYLFGRPGLTKAIKAGTDWIFHGVPLDPWAAKQLMGACKGDRAYMKKFEVSHPVGALVCSSYKQLCLVASKPQVNNSGAIVVDVLVDGQVQTISCSLLTKESL